MHDRQAFCAREPFAARGDKAVCAIDPRPHGVGGSAAGARRTFNRQMRVMRENPRSKTGRSLIDPCRSAWVILRGELAADSGVGFPFAETPVMRHSRMPAIVFAVAAASFATLVASGAARAQVRDCVIVGNIAPFGINSEGTIDMNAGETCKMHLTTSGTVENTKVSLRPKNGTLTMEGAGSASYKPKKGFKGTDEFAVTVTGRGPTSVGTSVLKVRANVK
jgi:hypothetical protein